MQRGEVLIDKTSDGLLTSSVLYFSSKVAYLCSLLSQILTLITIKRLELQVGFCHLPQSRH